MRPTIPPGRAPQPKTASAAPLLGLASLILLLAGCERSPNEPAAGPALLELSVGPAIARVEVAATPERRRRGLMDRRELPEDQGMLFVFDRPQRLSFYMRNTHIPLDIGYFDEAGVLREIRPLYPRDETPVRSRSDNLLYALEMNQGWFRKKGVKTGDRLDLEAVRRRLQAR